MYVFTSEVDLWQVVGTVMQTLSLQDQIFNSD